MSSARLFQPIPGFNRRRRLLKWLAGLSLSLLSDLRIDIFPSLRHGRRARATIRFGPVFSPFEATRRGRQRRRQVDNLGHVLMQHIAPLIPLEQRVYYSDDPQVREAAVYPVGRHNSAGD